jgi:hypothetical protein
MQQDIKTIEGFRSFSNKYMLCMQIIMSKKSPPVSETNLDPESPK